MQLHQLKYFVSVVNSGSITKAAERCFISQPSISQQIAKLEENIGKKIFTKLNGKLVLTEPGRILYEQASKILKSVEDTKRRVSDYDSAHGGIVNIGILPTLAPFLLPGPLAALSEKFPDAVVTVREDISESLVAAAKRGELDILLEVLPFDESNLSVEHLFLDPFCLAVNCGHPLAENEEIHVDVLEGMSFILLEDIHCLTRQIERFCFSEKFIPKVAFQASQINTIKLLIESQYGISILPSISRDRSSDSNIRFIRLVGNDRAPEREVVLAVAKDRYLGPAAEFFIEAVKEQYKKL